MRLFNNMSQQDALMLYNAIKNDLTTNNKLTRQDINLLHNAQQDILTHTNNLKGDYR